jgi:hypothetical protein
MEDALGNSGSILDQPFKTGIPNMKNDHSKPNQSNAKPGTSVPDPSMAGLRNEPAPPRTPEQRDKDRSGYDPKADRTERRS